MVSKGSRSESAVKPDMLDFQWSFNPIWKHQKVGIIGFTSTKVREATWPHRKVALTMQRYQNGHRIFDTLLKPRRYHRFGGPQFSGIILVRQAN